MYLAIEKPEDKKLVFSEFVNKERYDYFSNGFKIFNPLRLIYLDCSDIARLTTEILEETKISKKDIVIRDKFSLLLSKFKSWIDKWKHIFKAIDNENYITKTISNEIITNKYFCLIYNLRNYEQHQGSAISYYNDTNDKPLEIYFADITKLIDFQNGSWKQNFTKHWSNINEVSLNPILIDLAKVTNKLNKDFSKKLLELHPTLLKILFDFKILSNEINILKNQKYFLFDKMPSDGIANFTKMLDNELITYLLTLVYKSFTGCTPYIEKTNRSFEIKTIPNVPNKYPIITLPQKYSIDKKGIVWVELLFTTDLITHNFKGIYAVDGLDVDNYTNMIDTLKVSK